jgi:hypothetical protein
MAGVMLVAMGTVSAQEWMGYKIEAPKDGAMWKEVDMLDSEREEYATNLATYAANREAASGKKAALSPELRRVIAVALRLSPRNRKALVTLFQINKGVVPEKTEGDYSPQVFARLLLARGQSLEKQTGADNQLLGRVFIELAAQIDPKNEDAVYASEVNRLDHGAVDWSAVMK